MNASSSLLSSDSVRKWTSLIPGRNLLHILQEYFVLFLVLSATVVAMENGPEWGIPGWAVAAISVIAVIVTGIQFHRIALLGHESSHYMLMENRKLNDFFADVLCFIPLWSALVNYRMKHSGHHLHPNEPYRDPNLGSDRSTELFKSFPMKKPSSIYRYYALFFWPPFVIGNLIEIFKLLVLGQKPTDKEKQSDAPRQKLITKPGFLGILYCIGLFGILTWARESGSATLIIFAPLAFYAIAAIGGILILPRKSFENTGAKLHYNRKLAAFLRLTFCTVVFTGATWCRFYTGFNVGFYYCMFWLFPLFYVFPYLMLLRELYQHANLGTGKLDNSRIIHADPFTRWALLPYGNDFHLIHHIYPNIPHYHLISAHQELLNTSEDYRRELIEVSGTFRGDDEHISVSESLAVQN